MSADYCDGVTTGHAEISSCQRFRYLLTRSWAGSLAGIRWVCFVGCNPSTADALDDDPTIRREVGFARAIGATALVKVNLCPRRETRPDRLRLDDLTAEEAIQMRETNARWLRHAAGLGRSYRGIGVVAAWGAAPAIVRAEIPLAMQALGAPLLCLGVTKDGSPRHPLYLPRTAAPVEWQAAQWREPR